VVLDEVEANGTNGTNGTNETEGNLTTSKKKSRKFLYEYAIS
jgi:hypothetical protein